MIYSVPLLLSLSLVPLLVQLRGFRPAALFFAAAVVYAVFGIVSFASTQIILSQVQEAEPAYQDTYYVVSDGYYLWNIAIAMSVFGVITWVQTRFGAMRYPNLTKLLFWILHIAQISSTALQGMLAFILPTPRRYIDYSELMGTHVLISSWSGFLSQAALLGLLFLLIWSIVAKWLVR